MMVISPLDKAIVSLKLTMAIMINYTLYFQRPPSVIT